MEYESSIHHENLLFLDLHHIIRLDGTIALVCEGTKAQHRADHVR